MPVDAPDQVAGDLPGEDHPHDLHRLRRGVAVPGAELGEDAEPFQHLGDLRAAAVDDDRADADQAEIDYILGERVEQLRVDHRVAAELDHERLAVELLQPGQ
jgi:hypothetical protein